jgi:hypothetical protein
LSKYLNFPKSESLNFVARFTKKLRCAIVKGRRDGCPRSLLLGVSYAAQSEFIPPPPRVSE